MRLSYAYYDLQDGYIDHWLTVGPQQILAAPEELAASKDRANFTAIQYNSASGVINTPVERGPLTKGNFQSGDYTGSWLYIVCGMDHYVDQSTLLSSPQLLRSWAYIQVNSKQAQNVLFRIQASGAFDLWLNEQHSLLQKDYPAEINGFHGFDLPVALSTGVNKVLLRWESAGVGPCTHAMSMQILAQDGSQAASGLRLRIPTLIRDLKRRRELEKSYQAAYLDREVFAQNDHIALRWPDDPASAAKMTVRLRAKAGGIYGQAEIDGAPGDVLTLGTPLQMPAGPAEIEMLPSLLEYYENDLRLTHRMPIQTMGILNFTDTPYSDFTSRRREALTWAARHAQPIYKAAATGALGAWKDLETKEILQAIQRINSGEIDAAVQLLGALGLVPRFHDQAAFPQEIKAAVQEAASAYHFSAPAPIYAEDQSQQLLRLSCELLAGQLFPDALFTVENQIGRFHQQRAEGNILALLQRIATLGMDAWNSSQALDRLFTALAHLADLAQAEAIWELGGVMLDKLFFSLALNTFKGAYGAARSETLAGEAKNGMLSPVAGITRLMWGLGIYNQHLTGVVSLACCENYELPVILADIACRYPDEMLDQQRQGETPVNSLVYRTPDYMLASALNYHPGTAGKGEHLWQATFNASALVFVNHPACSSQEDGRQPNYWAGNSSLPRLAQWKDTLIGLYRLAADDPLGFTHAYFPEYAFDDVVYSGQWAFARCKSGYLALMASNGLERVQNGRDAFRELRSHGRENIWLCLMGRQAVDGDFAQFQQKVLHLLVQTQDCSISLQSLRGEKLQLDWNRPLMVNGKEVSLSNNHFNNPYCQAAYPCEEILIQTTDYRLRLDLSAP